MNKLNFESQERKEKLVKLLIKFSKVKLNVNL